MKNDKRNHTKQWLVLSMSFFWIVKKKPNCIKSYHKSQIRVPVTLCDYLPYPFCIHHSHNTDLCIFCFSALILSLQLLHQLVVYHLYAYYKVKDDTLANWSPDVILQNVQCVTIFCYEINIEI